jgi:alpha-galactosidase
MKLRFYRIMLTALILSFWHGISVAQDSIALTPPMGWASWNCFSSDISEEKIRAVADAMVTSGMKDAGYEYVNIDDGWATESRDADGHIIVDSVKFPNGIKALADYIHSLGLKFGIYSAPGCMTCAGNMGSLGYEQIDANDYASWGVDFLKYDWCEYPSNDRVKETSEEECRNAFELMRDCLEKTGRPILYSIHERCRDLTEASDVNWAKSVANMCRTSNDIKNDWNRMLWCLESTADLWEHAGPGYWNDPDMLEVGNENKEFLWGELKKCVKMNFTEYRTHFSMWCVVAAPLLAGNDLCTMTPEITEILTNKEVIAINQDPPGRQGRRIRDDGELEVWAKELSGNRFAIALLNRSTQPADIQIDWQEIGMEGKLKVRDLWKHKNLGKFKDSFIGKNIASHEAMVLLIEK